MYDIILYLLGIGILLCLVRVIRGPTAPDRVLAADTIGVLAVAFIVIFALYHNNPMFVDVALIISILSFVGTLAISRYIGGEWQ
jgi:multisubunit Na+/H+ antiporter MnhF subunit